MQRRTASKKQADPSSSVGAVPYIYRVVVERDDDRYYAEIPTLPGCYSWGHSYEEALRNVKEALELWLEVKKEAGEAIPTDDPRTIRNATLTIGVLV
ncbi:MAG: type II toxin-antitoxin system HicB family antitoxin [Terriglobia bacterium]